MNYSPKSPTTKPEGVREPLVGGDVLDVVQAGKGDLSDWVELMEAVEALCPVWPMREHSVAMRFNFLRPGFRSPGFRKLSRTPKALAYSVPFSNVFEQLIEEVRYDSLGQISHALCEVGGEYRRNI